MKLSASEAINLDGGTIPCMILMKNVINRSENTKEKDLRTVNGMIGIRQGE